MLSRRQPCRLVAWTVAATALAPATARADDPIHDDGAYQLSIELDLPIVLVAGAAATSFFFLDESGHGPACNPSCDADTVNPLDRPAAGLYDASWSSVGDVATVTTLVIPPLVVLLAEGPEHGLQDDLVLAEAALVTAALQVSLSYAVQRPRPRVYGDEAPLEDRTDTNAARSFFSGHVAETMAVSVAALRTFQRLDRDGLGWAVLAAGASGSTFVGVARVASGAHFPTDVVIGAAAGAGMGLALPAVHDAPVRVLPMVAEAGGGISVSLVQ